MTEKRKLADCFENGWFKEEYLWELRQEIVLGSLYYADYRNSFGIDEHKVCDFFTSFWDSFCEELAKEDNLWEEACIITRDHFEGDANVSLGKYDLFREETYRELFQTRYDNEKTLKSWYNCFADNGPESSPLPPKMVNVDIHWDFARSIQVIAADEDEAEEIVEAMMRDGSIPKESFEATEDWELDTTYQPE